MVLLTEWRMEWSAHPKLAFKKGSVVGRAHSPRSIRVRNPRILFTNNLRVFLDSEWEQWLKLLRCGAHKNESASIKLSHLARSLTFVTTVETRTLPRTMR